MKKKIRNFLLTLFLILNFIGCGLTRTVYHKVIKGETLNSIAKKYNIKKSWIIKLNNIINPNRIFVGQKLAIRSDIKNFRRPTSDRKKKPDRNSGIDIIASSGKDILSLTNGEVVFSGLIKNYGGGIIVKYNTGWYISYFYVKTISVSCGDNVKAGQVIAQTGWLSNREQYGVRLEVRRGSVVKDPKKVFANLKLAVKN